MVFLLSAAAHDMLHGAVEQQLNHPLGGQGSGTGDLVIIPQAVAGAGLEQRGAPGRPLLGGILPVDLSGDGQRADEARQGAHAAQGPGTIEKIHLALVALVIFGGMGKSVAGGVEELAVDGGVGVSDEAALVVLQHVHKAVVAGGDQAVGQKAHVFASRAAVEARIVVGDLFLRAHIGGEGGNIPVVRKVVPFCIFPFQLPPAPAAGRSFPGTLP